MYIAEWSVVKDIGEAKLYPFFFLSDSRDCEPFSSDSAIVTWVQKERELVDRIHVALRQGLLRWEFFNQLYLLFWEAFFSRAIPDSTFIKVNTPRERRIFTEPRNLHN